MSEINNNIQRPVGNSHFFTEPTQITQSEQQSFGPFGATDTEKQNQFRLSSKFDTVDEYANAYAICSGNVLILPQTGDSDRVNLVLKPRSQPISGIPIRYIIYRGLRYADFFHTPFLGNQVRVNESEPDSTDLLGILNETFNEFFGQNPPDFLAEYIGFEKELTNTEVLLEDYFNKNSDLPSATEPQPDLYELMPVKGGTKLGRFKGDNCGIDIVLDQTYNSDQFHSSNFSFDLEYATASSAELILNPLESATEKKIKREAIFNFWDITAFYGLHVEDGQVAIWDNGLSEFNPITGVDIYNVLENFKSKNNWYVYVKAERDRSYGYYDDYFLNNASSNNLLMSLNGLDYEEGLYATHNWPLLINKTTQPVTDGYNKLSIKLKSNSFNSTKLFLLIGSLEGFQTPFFAGPDSLTDIDSDFHTTKPIQIKLRAVEEVIDQVSLQNNIASISYLLYRGGVLALSQNPSIEFIGDPGLNSTSDFNNIFKLRPSASAIPGNPLSKYTITMDNQPKLVSIERKRTTIAGSVVNCGTLDDFGIDKVTQGQISRVTYFTESASEFEFGELNMGKISTILRSTSTQKTSDPENISLSWSRIMEKYLFTENTIEIEGFSLNGSDTLVSGTLILGITTSEEDVLKNLVQADMTAPFLFINNIMNQDVRFVSDDGLLYAKYNLGLSYEDDLGELQIIYPLESIEIYSIDGKCFFSREFTNSITQSFLSKSEKLKN